MVCLKASVKETAEKAIAGKFFVGTMFEKPIGEFTQRFGDPKKLTNKFRVITTV